MKDMNVKLLILDFQGKHQNTQLQVQWFLLDGKFLRNFLFWSILRSAPEVLRKQNATSKSDVFSFGIVIHEILDNGEIPYKFLYSNNAVYEYVDRGQRLEKLPQCPDDLYKLMTECWREAPNERPTFKEILNSLLAMQGKAPEVYREEGNFQTANEQHYN